MGWLRRSYDKAREVFGRVFRSPFYPVPLTLAVAFTGLFGSIYTNEIKSAPPFSWLAGLLGLAPGTSVSGNAWHAVVAFWVLFVLSALMYYPREHVLERDRREETDELIRRVRTLPPADFLSLFAVVHDKCREAVLVAREKPEKSTRAEAIRLILSQVASLAKKFDSAGPGVRYAANVMLFVRSADLTEAEARDALNERLRFREEEVRVEHLKGALDVQTALSATDSSPDRDSELAEFALPIPEAARSPAGKWRALPGAPIAFLEKDMDVYTDTRTLGEWCERHGDFTQEVVRQLTEYFTQGEGKSVRSFVSVALRAGTAGDPLGVLNIHSNAPGILREQEPSQQFVSVMRPLVAMLADTTRLWIDTDTPAE